MKIIFATVLLFAVAATGAYSQACHLREVDLCTAMGMFHYQSNGVPADEEKLTEWCETMTEVGDCMGNFSAKCMSPLQREVSGLLSGGEETGKELCTEGSEARASYLEQAECIAEGAESDTFKENLRDVQVVIEELFVVPFKSRFGLFCCGLERFNKKVADYTRETCGEAAVEMVRTILSMVTSDMPATICQHYDPEGEQCQKILPPSGTQPRGDSKSNIAKLFNTVFGNV